MGDRLFVRFAVVFSLPVRLVEEAFLERIRFVSRFAVEGWEEVLILAASRTFVVIIATAAGRADTFPLNCCVALVRVPAA
jgi:hypothetical protein